MVRRAEVGKPSNITGTSAADNNVPGLFSPKESVKTDRSIPSSSEGVPGAFKVVLDPTDSIPVYDGRLGIIDRPIKLASMIDRIPMLGLPLYRKEIRPNSAALVVYTTAQYFNGSGSARYPNLSLNIQWVLLISSPPM
ncbi:hypothetical protein GLOTRDRAFT_133173 [Gloeophyllum trabeum ATCC 11539]|uniref:Uncharacterized protein n=1 Tax=Gloeophyllum trabeum (strain ATCC 11539 / FP-39264 / Madison 617) TaxID=670483 RepID=S7PV62_GLOTA|nr:uncharacterized protein GLOTRDRAFT_133173 [Gloeophyllum trabeum ATCC 11539]EPQ51302.1 hypothetical protein GLOTRDRAFT_133173 [Gloeophyllum trabeum ATCC 11539]